MMNSDVPMSTIVIYAMWVVSGLLISAGWVAGQVSVGQYGVMTTAIAATMTIVRDNNRTRRLIRRRQHEVRGRQV